MCTKLGKYVILKWNGDDYMKKFFEMFNVFVKRLTLLYTVLVTVMTVVGYDANKYGLKKESIIGFLLFSCLTALFLTLCDLIKNNAIIRNALKFILVYGSFAISIFTSKAMDTRPDKLYTVSMLSMLFVFAYVAVCIVNIIANSIKKKILNKNTEYTSVFTKT